MKTWRRITQSALLLHVAEPTQRWLGMTLFLQVWHSNKTRVLLTLLNWVCNLTTLLIKQVAWTRPAWYELLKSAAKSFKTSTLLVYSLNIALAVTLLGMIARLYWADVSGRGMRYKTRLASRQICKFEMDFGKKKKNHSFMDIANDYRSGMH